MKKSNKTKTLKVIEEVAGYLAIIICVSFLLFSLVGMAYPAIYGVVPAAYIIGWVLTGLAIAFWLDRPTL